MVVVSHSQETLCLINDGRRIKTPSIISGMIVQNVDPEEKTDQGRVA